MESGGLPYRVDLAPPSEKGAPRPMALDATPEADAAQQRRRALQRLGEGSDEDRLGFRLVLQIFLRCVNLLKGVKRHVMLLIAGWAVLLAVLIVPGLVFSDLMTTRVLVGEPLTEIQAWLVWMDPAETVEVEALTGEQRRQVARRGLVLGAVGGGLILPAVLALIYYYVWILQRVNQL